MVYAVPLINEKQIITLVGHAGWMQGVGDWRNEKGNDNYGSWEVVKPSDADYKRIVRTGGRKQQIEAMDNPRCFNAESKELFGWFEKEVVLRGFRKAV